MIELKSLELLKSLTDIVQNGTPEEILNLNGVLQAIQLKAEYISTTRRKKEMEQEDNTVLSYQLAK